MSFQTWVRVGSQHLQRISGLEHVRDLAPDRGVFLVANHRSFFDFYVISAVVLRNSDWVKRMYFPVRSTFFYEGVAGMAVNAVMSAMAMYPPPGSEKSRTTRQLIALNSGNICPRSPQSCISERRA